MRADPVRARVGSRVRRLHQHGEALLLQRVLDPEIERERIARARVEAVLERGAIDLPLHDRPLRPADEAMNGVPPLGLVERELEGTALELVRAVLDPVRPRREDLSAAGAAELVQPVAVEHRRIAEPVTAQTTADADDDRPLVAVRELDLLAGRAGRFLHARRFDAAAAEGFIPIGRCARRSRFLALTRMSPLASTAVDLARIQFATTTLYHFLFVPLTLGLGPLVAIMQTLWYRSGDEAWLRLTRFFGTLLLINFAIGVATGLVQEFEFGMNWSVYSKFVGNVFGAPLAIEGLAAFMLESTFLGLWIFGWNRLSPRLHLATLWIAVVGSWLSGYFILVANSWMQHPVGYKIVDGEAQLTSVWALLSNGFALRAYVHTMLAGLIFGSIVMLGVCCWHFLRGHDVDLFRKAAKLALIVAVPVTLLQLVVGNRFGEAVTSAQGMKIAASEAQWNTCEPCGFSLIQFGGFSKDDETPAFAITVPRLLSYMATGSFDGQVQGLNQLQAQEQSKYGSGNYMPNVRVVYWSMRVMAFTGVLMFMVAALGAWLYWKKKLERARWFHRIAIVSIAFPYIAASAGWVLTEMGRQPWIVQGLLKTSEANSPSVSTAWIAISLAFFITLYLVLGVVDFVLMRRYARPDRPPTRDELPQPAVTF